MADIRFFETAELEPGVGAIVAQRTGLDLAPVFRVGMSQQDRVIELRDMALAVLKVRGQWQEVHNGPRLLVFHGAVFIAYRAFGRLPPGRQRTASKGKPSAVPYGLDIFAGGKVLNVEWDSDDHIHIERYHPGEWERELEKLVSAGTKLSGA